MNCRGLLLLLSVLLFAPGCGDEDVKIIVPDPSSEISAEEADAMMRQNAPDAGERAMQQAIREHRMGGT